MTLQLDPASVIHEGPTCTSAVNRNQHLLGKSMLVLNWGAPAGTEQRPVDATLLTTLAVRLRAALPDQPR